MTNKKLPMPKSKPDNHFNDVTKDVGRDEKKKTWFKNLKNYLKPKGLKDQKIEL